jgi:hypothetical protein
LALTALADCQYFRHETRDLRIQSVLFGRERAANLQKGNRSLRSDAAGEHREGFSGHLGGYPKQPRQSVCRVTHRRPKDFPATWAITKNNLGAYAELPIGDRAANLQKAIGAYEAALRMRTEKDFPADRAETQNNLGNAYADLPARDRAANLQKAIGAYEAALRVRTEKDFPATWAETHATSAKRMPSFQTGIARRI